MLDQIEFQNSIYWKPWLLISQAPLDTPQSRREGSSLPLSFSLSFSLPVSHKIIYITETKLCVFSSDTKEPGMI